MIDTIVRIKTNKQKRIKMKMKTKLLIVGPKRETTLNWERGGGGWGVTPCPNIYNVFFYVT